VRYGLKYSIRFKLSPLEMEILKITALFTGEKMNLRIISPFNVG
jgi:hypothetical protein